MVQHLNKITMIQEEFRDLLHSQEADKPGGKTLDEEQVQGAAKKYSEDAIVNTATVLYSVYGENTFMADLLRDAVTVLDFWDTLGMEVRYKE